MAIKQQLEKLMIKYFNYILFTILLLLFFFLNINSKISTNIHSLLPESENKELFKEFLGFDNNKKIFVYVEGLGKESLKEIEDFEKQIIKINGIRKELIKNSIEYEKYKKKYALYLNDINFEKIETLNVSNELKKIYYEIIGSFITFNINEIDPFNLIEEKEISFNIKNGYLVANNKGYLTIYTLDKSITSLNSYDNIYKQIKEIETNNITTFSSIYYFVENSNYIKNDANKIVIIATLLLLFLYLFILKNLNLLSNTILTLASSSLISTIIISYIYNEVSLFVLVFGLSITTISIDYMFHHYFHNKYKKEYCFNKEVFLGFLTTYTVFFIFNFTDFLLIKQISQFAMISLLSSYIIFSFIYPRMSFNQNNFKIIDMSKFKVNKMLFFIISCIILLFTFNNINFNFDIKSLDYDNKKLKGIESFFQNQFNDKDMRTVLIKAKTINELIFYNEQIKQIDSTLKSDLNKLVSNKKFNKIKNSLKETKLHLIKKDIAKYIKSSGLKKDSFNNAYNYNIESPSYTYNQIRSFNIAIKKYKEEYISYIHISSDKYNEIIKKDYIYPLSLKILFEKQLQNDLNKIINLGLVSLIFIALIIVFITKEKAIQAFNFLLLPSSLIFLYFSFISVNILHIFMLFIILAISIDYAIYSSKDNTKKTQKAIIFSAISSFAGFGVLVFSTTPSLFSIGSVATIGILAILILIFFQKVNNASKSL